MNISSLGTKLWQACRLPNLSHKNYPRGIHQQSLKITLFDGSMGGILFARGYIDANGIWSAKALIEHPKAVKNLHKEYIASGADVITTNTYATIPYYLGKKNLEHEYPRLTQLGGQVARQAVLESGRMVQVAGSLPPLSESYRPSMQLDEIQAQQIYKIMAQALVPYVDLFLCETMSSLREAVTAVKAVTPLALQTKKPIYVSFSLHEEPGKGLRSGEPITEILQQLSPLNVSAYLFNCTSSTAIEHAVRVLAKLTTTPLGGRPNRLDPVPEGWRLDEGGTIPVKKEYNPEMFVNAALSCIDAGATLYGGCCGIGPNYIRALDQAIQSRQER
ncbi:MAG: homocysteine S-methyltransferase family protein [Chlamydiales bacterium]